MWGDGGNGLCPDYFHQDPPLVLSLCCALSAKSAREEGIGALDVVLALLKNCEARAAAMDESKTNSPTPMYFSTALRADSEVMRSRSGLIWGGGRGGDTQNDLSCDIAHPKIRLSLTISQRTA